MRNHRYLAGWIAVAVAATGFATGTAIARTGHAATRWLAGQVAGEGRDVEVAMDVDGDGRMDLVHVHRDDAGRAIAAVSLADGDGGFAPVSSADVGSWCLKGDCRFVVVPMDVDGDGRMDLVREAEIDGARWAYAWVSDGQGFALKSLSRLETPARFPGS